MPKGPTFPFRTGGNIEPFDFFASVTINAGLAGTVLEFVTPTSFKKGYITLFGHGIDNVAAWPTSTFSILVDGNPVRSYELIADQLGEFRQPEEIGPIVIRPGARVTITAANGSATNNLYAGRLRGFYDFEGA